MNETKLISGKVVKISLAVVQPPSGPETPVLKRLALPQGELAQFYDGADGIRYIAFIELLAGNSRGNHYHKHKEEWIYLVRGELSLVLQDMDSKEKATVPMAAGDLVKISPGVAHTLKIIQPGDAIEFSTARFDASDIHRHVLI